MSTKLAHDCRSWIQDYMAQATNVYANDRDSAVAIRKQAVALAASLPSPSDDDGDCDVIAEQGHAQKIAEMRSASDWKHRCLEVVNDVCLHTGLSPTPTSHEKLLQKLRLDGWCIDVLADVLHQAHLNVKRVAIGGLVKWQRDAMRVVRAKFMQVASSLRVSKDKGDAARCQLLTCEELKPPPPIHQLFIGAFREVEKYLTMSEKQRVLRSTVGSMAEVRGGKRALDAVAASSTVARRTSAECGPAVADHVSSAAAAHRHSQWCAFAQSCIVATEQAIAHPRRLSVALAVHARNFTSSVTMPCVCTNGRPHALHQLAKEHPWYFECETCGRQAVFHGLSEVAHGSTAEPSSPMLQNIELWPKAAVDGLLVLWLASELNTSATPAAYKHPSVAVANILHTNMAATRRLAPWFKVVHSEAKLPHTSLPLPSAALRGTQWVAVHITSSPWFAWISALSTTSMRLKVWENGTGIAANSVHVQVATQGTKPPRQTRKKRKRRKRG